MPYDPKLKEAAAEIKAICRKHDIAAHVALVSPSHAEFVMVLDPTWSACQLTDNRLKIRAKSKEIGHEVAHKLMGGTAHMVCRIQDMCTKAVDDMDNILAALAPHIKINHTTGAFTPHKEQ